MISTSPLIQRARTSSVAATPPKKVTKKTPQNLVFELSVTSPSKAHRFEGDPYDDCGDGPDEPVHEIHKTVKSAVKSGWEYVLGELDSDESGDEDEFRDCFKNVDAKSGGMWVMPDEDIWGERLVLEINPKKTSCRFALGGLTSTQAPRQPLMLINAIQF